MRRRETKADKLPLPEVRYHGVRHCKWRFVLSARSIGIWLVFHDVRLRHHLPLWGIHCNRPKAPGYANRRLRIQLWCYGLYSKCLWCLPGQAIDYPNRSFYTGLLYKTAAISAVGGTESGGTAYTT